MSWRLKKRKKNEHHLTEQIQNYVPYILRYLYQLAYPDYERLKKDGTLTQLKNLTCYSLESLKVKYSLNSEFVFNERGFLLYNGNLYIQKDQLEYTDNLAIELSKVFGNIRGLDDFLISLFYKKTGEKIENLLKAKGIQELSDDEKEWFGTIPTTTPKGAAVAEKKRANNHRAPSI